MLDVDQLDPVERRSLRSALVLEIVRQQRRRVEGLADAERAACDERLIALDAMLDRLACR